MFQLLAKVLFVMSGAFLVVATWKWLARRRQRRVTSIRSGAASESSEYGQPKVGHVNQVLPIVRYWIPHLRIISPEGLQGELERELARYVEFGQGTMGRKGKEEGRS